MIWGRDCVFYPSCCYDEPFHASKQKNKRVSNLLGRTFSEIECESDVLLTP